MVNLVKKSQFFLIFFFFVYYFACGLFYFYKSPPKGDEVHYLLTAISIVQDKDIAIGNNYENKDNQPWYETLDKHTVRGRDGKEYMYHGLGLYPFLLAFGFFLFGRFGAMLTMISVALATLYLLFYLIRKLTDSQSSAVAAVSLVGLTLPFLEYSYLLFPEIIGALLVTIIFLCLLNKRYTASVLIGLLPWIHVRFLPISIGFLIIFLFYGKITARKFSFIIVSSLLITLYFLFLNYIFGSFDPRYPYTLLGISTQPANVLLNIVNIFTDGQYGILFYGLFWIFLLPGFYLWYRNNKKSLSIVVLPLLLYLITTFSYYDWNGGYSPPGRYVVAIIPLILPAIGYVFKSLKKNWIIAISSISIVYGQASFLLNFLSKPDFGFLYMNGVTPYLETVSKLLGVYISDLVPHFYPVGETNIGHFIYLFLFLSIGIVVYKLGKRNKQNI